MRKLLCILALVLVCGLPAAGQKTSMKKLESQRAQLEKDIALLNRKLEQNAKNKDAALSNLSLLKSKIRTREKLIDGCDQTIRMLDDSITVCQKELNKLQARHDTLSLYYGRLVRAAYKNRDSRLWYMYILSSESIGQGLERAGPAHPGDIGPAECGEGTIERTAQGSHRYAPESGGRTRQAQKRRGRCQ